MLVTFSDFASRWGDQGDLDTVRLSIIVAAMDILGSLPENIWIAACARTDEAVERSIRQGAGGLPFPAQDEAR
jgi:hypothetical protein